MTDTPDPHRKMVTDMLAASDLKITQASRRTMLRTMLVAYHDAKLVALALNDTVEQRDREIRTYRELREAMHITIGALERLCERHGIYLPSRREDYAEAAGDAPKPKLH